MQVPIAALKHFLAQKLLLLATLVHAVNMSLQEAARLIEGNITSRLVKSN
jgi:hypothetical protein